MHSLLRFEPTNSVVTYLLLASLHLLGAQQGLAAEGRGYEARACGFDMNRNGIVGEAADCNVCDGVTADPDLDGIDEDLLYIDADSGSDGVGSGSPQNPFRTIQHAWNVADGPGDGAEDILCFRGTATDEESITPGVSGVAGTYSVARSGSQERAWLYPRNPTMLVGWDSDDDGAYPPFDADDVALLDGTGNGVNTSLARVFRLGPAIDYLEVAHLEVLNYGRYSPGADSGLVAHGPTGDGVDYVYYHDMELRSINRDRAGDGNDFTIDLFNSGLHWAQFNNLSFTDNGGWFARGAGPNSGPDEGPIRWQNITRTTHGCDFSDCGNAAGWPTFKIWGYISRLEILDSVWDANVANWQPRPDGGHGTQFLVIAQCSQDWTVRNNEIIDASVVLTIQPTSAGFCDDADARPIQGAVFDRNEARNTYTQWGFGNVGVQILRPASGLGEGNVAGESVGSVSVTNNFLSTAGVPWEACFWSVAGNGVASPPGEVVFANNTCSGEIRRWAAISIGAVDGLEAPAFPQQDVLIKNNIVTGLNPGERNAQFAYQPQRLEMDFNVFDPAGTWEWTDGSETNLPTWRANSGADQSSAACQPAFVGAASGDYHLLLADTCARDFGEALPTVTAVDFDGDARGQSFGWDVGGDEVDLLFADGFESGDLSAW